MTYIVIIALSALMGYSFAIYTLSKRISFDRFIILERLYMAAADFYRAENFEDIEVHGERIRNLVIALGGKVK